MVNKVREMRVATYNVRTDTDYDQDWSWDYRKNEVVKLITYHNWDIFGVQETLPNQVQDLAQIKGYTNYHAEREGDLKGEGLGVYFKTDQFECLNKGFFWLSETPSQVSIHPEAGCKRIAVWLILKDKKSSKEFLIINTHLDHISDVARLEGMGVVLKELEQEIANYPTILLGDFNSEPTEILHEELKTQFSYPKNQRDVFTYGPAGTFQDFNYDISWSELQEIDYILYKDFQCTKQGVLTDSCDRRFPSDHFPVVATFKI